MLLVPTVLMLLLMLVMAAAGVLATITGRRTTATTDPTADPTDDRTAGAGRLADRLAERVDTGLGRTARAVEQLVEPRAGDGADDARGARPVPPRERRTAYLVAGSGLMGLAATTALGLLLVVAG